MYKGITYFSFLDNNLIHKLWKKFFCKKEIHLFDEVFDSEKEHFLYCDACDLKINIKPEESS